MNSLHEAVYELVNDQTRYATRSLYTDKIVVDPLMLYREIVMIVERFTKEQK